MFKKFVHTGATTYVFMLVLYKFHSLLIELILIFD